MDPVAIFEAAPGRIGLSKRGSNSTKVLPKAMQFFKAEFHLGPSELGSSG